MVALWERMGQWFGGLWEASYGTVNDQTIYAWTGALNQFSEQEIAGAMKQMEAWEEKYPPTFPQFRALCMAARSKARPSWTEERIATERRGNPIAGVLEHLSKRGLSETAKRELAKMRELVNG